VAPSAIDIHATANFVRDLLLVGRIRTRNIQLAVVANRVRSSMPVYQPLERFLNSLGLPFLTRISDSDTYVKAAESGIGIFEMAPSTAAECSEFMPIVDWLGRQRDSVASGDGKVIDLASRRWTERTPGLSSIGSRS
jgi:chromosome partitioning protein